ncbi:glycyl-radical enzyme activating protein [Biomaibacter acetigenes]|uniref:Glycyl-radical enzyme activating protein n=1 Tax=Biomaibacter acetigenes TaxID=2316383 RepID=A0A3G2R3Q8_9FIRM|nr:glycyl-radical enzyme activating protein [Biomaibacter acetigenes]AYO29981.1 glycyl-radical enzyme activating protein [Biomaibacter acetigenes]
MSIIQKHEGIIFDIQRYSIHDGPGIRTVVFLKGCPLRCLWCCNPESQLTNPQLSFIQSKCIGCLECIKICPNKAIRFDKEKGFLIDYKLCDMCGRCSDVCYPGARVIIGKKMSVDEVIAEVIKDKSFYNRSNGGVTLSGGEVLLQWGFAKEILKKCKELNINTAIETCGYCKWEYFTEVLEYVDLVLYDLKHLDSAEHKRLTGVDNQLILENAAKVVKKGKEMIIRVPLIPSLNDSKDNIMMLVDFVSTLEKVKEIDLLPYHQLGVSKYNQIGQTYKLNEINPPSKEKINDIKRYIENRGFLVKVGG